MSPQQRVSVHLNWRGIAVLVLLAGSLAVGLYIATTEVADTAAQKSVRRTQATLRETLYQRDVASTETLQRGCALNTEFKRYMIAFLNSAATAREGAPGELNKRTAAEYRGYEKGLVDNLPPGTSRKLGAPTTCDDFYPLPPPPAQ